MNIDQLRAHIPEYLLGKADPEICREIDAAVELDSDFRAELEMERATLTAARIYRDGGLKDKLAAIQKSSARPLFQRSGFRWAVAAVVVFLFLIIVGFQIGNRRIRAHNFLQSPYPDQISEQYQEQLNSPGITEPAQLQDLIKGLTAYSSADYSTSESLLSSFLLTYPAADEVRFYLGLIQWQTGQQESAVQTWRKVAEGLLPLYRDEARLRLIAWHLSNWEFSQANMWKSRMELDALPQSLLKLEQLW